MQKPASLRAWLSQWLDIDAAQLEIFTNQGRVAHVRAANLSYEYRYQCNVVIMDYAGSVDDITIPMLEWINQHQVTLLGGANEPFGFETEILDGDRVDISITLELTESVRLILSGDGSGYDKAYVDKPAGSPLERIAGWPDARDPEWAGVAAKFRQGYAGDPTALVAQSHDPDAQPLDPRIPPIADDDDG